MSEELYRSGNWVVTRDWVKTPRHDWEVEQIQVISVSRAPLYSALAVSGVLIAGVVGLEEILFVHEMVVGSALAALLLGIGSQIGVLRVAMSADRSRSLTTAVGPMWIVTRVRDVTRPLLGKGRP